MKVGLSIDARYAAHVAPPKADRPPGVAGHPEHPGRLTAIEAELSARGLYTRTIAIPARLATRAELELVHTPTYIEALRTTISEQHTGWFDADTYFAEGSFDAAVLAAGATVDCVMAVVEGRVDRAFAIVRPPGHHALADHAMGFCLVNNVAVAAAAARAAGQRVAIFDWDVHHGNGTEAIFYEDGDVLYVSMHEWPQYPGTGARIDVGRGAGMGATVNVPVPSGTTSAEYLDQFRAVVLPAIFAFAPDIILVSAGFDAHRDDPLGGLVLDDETFRTLTIELLAIQPRLALVLEGGYSLPALACSVAVVVETLLESDLTAHATPRASGRPASPHP